MEGAPAVFEGDTIVLYCYEAKGFVSSQLVSSSFSHVDICPSPDDIKHINIPNIHFVSFQVLPDYVNSDESSVEKYLHSEGEKTIRHKLVYGRKVKLRHVASKQYLCISSAGDTKKLITLSNEDTDNKNSEHLLFKLLPLSKRNIGSTIYYKNEVILELVQPKGHQVLCGIDLLTKNYVLKTAVNGSNFKIHPHCTASDHVSTKKIRGGTIVRLYNKDALIDAYLRAGSPNDSGIDEDNIKIGARKKRLPPHGIPREPPVSGDCWWQLEKSDNPLDGTPFKFGDKCRLKHIPTQKYLAVTVPGTEFESVNKLYLTLREHVNNDFVIKSEHNLTDSEVTNGSTISLEYNNGQCLSIDSSSSDWVTQHARERKFGSKLYQLSLETGADDVQFKYSNHSHFEIDEVKPDNVLQIYFVLSVRNALKRIKDVISDKFVISDELMLNELSETLKNLKEYILKSGHPTYQKTLAKMLRNCSVIDQLYDCLTLQAANEKCKEVCNEVCNILEVLAKIPSTRCKKYLAKTPFLDKLCEKLGDNVGADRVLMALVENDNDIGKTVASKLHESLEESTNLYLNGVIIELISQICFSTSHKLSNTPGQCYCERIFKRREETSKPTHTKRISTTGFIKTLLEGQGLMYELNGEKKSLYELCSCEKSPDSDIFRFLIAQLKLFNRLCRSKANKEYIENRNKVLELVPFKAVAHVLQDSEIHSLAQSAYLECAISTHIGEKEIGCSTEDIWHCFRWERLEEFKNTKEPLKVANIEQNLIEEDLEESAKVSVILSILTRKLEDSKNLHVEDEYKNKLLYKLLTITEILTTHGFYWNLERSKSYFDLEDLVNMLDGSTDVYSDNPVYNKKYREEERYNYKPEFISIFRLKTKIVKILHDFFRRLTHLALEKMLHDFYHHLNSSLIATSADLIYPPRAFFEENMTAQLESGHVVLRISPYVRLQEYLEFEHYQYFDVTEEKGKRLVNILQDLMLYEDDELRVSSAGLLFDIYNKEDILFDKARSSHIIVGEGMHVNFYYNLIGELTYKDPNANLFSLRQGINDDEILRFWLKEILTQMMREDKTTCAQVTVFTCHFSHIMRYVLKFCASNEQNQKELLEITCDCLRVMCKGQEIVQEKIFENFTDLLKAEIAISSVARLLTEILTNNTTLCLQLTTSTIRQIYTLASSNSDDPEYLEYFTTLVAVMKPHKSAGVPSVLKIYQYIIAKLFFVTKTELMEDIGRYQRMDILQESDNNDTQLLKLLHITSLLATCCEEHQKYAEEKCQEIFSLEEILEILTSDIIEADRKIPFAHVLVGAYLTSESRSIDTIDKLSKNQSFLDHISNICTNMIQIYIERIVLQVSQDLTAAKDHLIKLFECHLTWNEMFKLNCDAKLHYFVFGIGPVITTICQELLRSKQELTDGGYKRIVRGFHNTLCDLQTKLTTMLQNNQPNLLTSKGQYKFWKKWLKSLSAVTTTDIDYEKLFTKEHFVFEKAKKEEDYINSEDEIKKNENLRIFISNYKKACKHWTKTRSLPTSKCMYEVTIPGGNVESSHRLLKPNEVFHYLIDLFTNDGNTNQLPQSNEVFNQPFEICELSILPLLEVLHRTLPYQASKQRVLMRGMLTTALKVLIGISTETFHDQCKENCQKQIKKFNKTVMWHLPHPNEDVTVLILGFIQTFLLIGNEETMQDTICDVIRDESNFFLRHRKITKGMVTYFDHVLKLVQECEEKNNMKHLGKEIERFNALQCETIFHERVCVALDLVSAMCDKQNIKMQNILREQDYTTVLKVNIVSEISLLLHTLAEMNYVSCKDEAYHEKCSIIITNIPDTIIKALQALIEVCAANYENQKVAHDGQVIDSINLILTVNDQYFNNEVKLVVMQCKAIELLEIMLEETNIQSKHIAEVIPKELNKEAVIQFIRKMYNKLYYCKGHHYEVCPDTKYCHMFLERNLYRAYHVLRTVSDIDTKFKKFLDDVKKDLDNQDNANEEKKKDNGMWKYLDQQTHSIEVNYTTKNEKEILRRVYFPFKQSETLSPDEKDQIQTNIKRDSAEEKARDLIKWSKSLLKRSEHLDTTKTKGKILKIMSVFDLPFHWILVFLTVLLNVFVLAGLEVPNSIRNDSSLQSSVVIIWPFVQSPHYDQWYIPLLIIFGVFHLILSIWTAAHYIGEKYPYFKFYVPYINSKINEIKEWLDRVDWFQNKITRGNSNWCNKLYKKLKQWGEQSDESQCFDIYIIDFYLIFHLLLPIFSLLSLIFSGYFYCFCLLYILYKIYVVRAIINALSGTVRQLFYVALLILSILLIYAVFSFVFLHNFFRDEKDLYCNSIFECYVTVIREGLLNGYGGAVPVSLNDRPLFSTYAWRTFIDLTFFAIISIIGLETITAILVDRFGEIRGIKEKADQDKKDVCFVCGIKSDLFENEKAGDSDKTFKHHYQKEHNMYDYMYYIIYIVQHTHPRDRNAIETYVYNCVKNNEIKFLPLEKALVIKKQDEVKKQDEEH